MSDTVHTPSIPDDILARADAALTEQRKRRDQARETAAADERCSEAVRAYCRATDALWLAEFSQPFDPQPHLQNTHDALSAAVKALADAGRLAEWEEVDSDEVYSLFRHTNNREMTRPPYEWARELFGRGRKGELPEALVVLTWETASLRDALRWLRVFLCGLSGEGAVLPRLGTAALPSYEESPDAGLPSVDDEDLSILRALARRAPLRLNLDQIEAATKSPRVSRRAVVPRVQRLLRLGLVARPGGPKGGHTLTPAGQSILAAATKSAP
jgi:hypothetical protein